MNTTDIQLESNMFIIVIFQLCFSLRFLCIFFLNLASYLFHKTLIYNFYQSDLNFLPQAVSSLYFYFYNHFLVLISVILICTKSAAWRENYDTTTLNSFKNETQTSAAMFLSLHLKGIKTHHIITSEMR